MSPANFSITVATLQCMRNYKLKTKTYLIAIPGGKTKFRHTLVYLQETREKMKHLKCSRELDYLKFRQI
ncbi:hypothetical protein GYH30_052149 [Glycine max]|uniref:Uncharacterized protein n=1 Tax=Glycine max TaxID=3847 RepID=K7MWS4_SOYBN|nr:hypothetical protein GYH30_052149 [Glycine max]